MVIVTLRSTALPAEHARECYITVPVTLSSRRALAQRLTGDLHVKRVLNAVDGSRLKGGFPSSRSASAATCRVEREDRTSSG